MLALSVNIFTVSKKYTHAGVAKLADALDLGSSGRPWGFESSHPHQKRAKILLARFYFLYWIHMNHS